MNKDKTSTLRLWIAVAFVGLALLFSVATASFSILYKQVSERSESILEYVKTQSLVFDSYNNASVMESQFRVVESARQVVRGLEVGFHGMDKGSLGECAVELGLTGIFVLDEEGNLEGSYSEDGIGFADLVDTITEDSALDTARHSKKVYVTRVAREDGSYVDVACAPRTDAPGYVAAVYYTHPEFSNRYMLTLQSMLSGYDAENDCSVVIESNGEVVASNTVDSDGYSDVAISDNDNVVVNGIKDLRDPGQMRLIRGGSKLYYGTYGQARNYYVYTFVPGATIFKKMGLAVGVALMMYILVIGIFAYARRRTAHRHYEEMIERERQYASQLEISARAAQSANNAKTEFLRRMSHDIRTPINGIRGMVEVANACPDDVVRQKECRDKIWMASGVLLDLVNEVLDISKLESGDVVLDVGPTDIEAQVDEVCEMLERQAQVHGISIVRVPYEIEHRYVYTSSIHLKRLVMNIASNAVKYNKDGGLVRVTCRETAFENDVATYEMVIEDTGIGMSEEFQRRVYEPFAREMQEVNREVSGTGLGLAITRHLVEIMGGTISFESELGKGTTYTVTLPLAVAEESECSIRPVSDLPQGSLPLEGVNILLAEDNELNREITEFVVMQAGARVRSVENGKQAVELFEASPAGSFDIILMDIMMPVMDGYEAAKAIRTSQHEDATNIPIVAASANAFAEDKRDSREAGMSEHIAKPIVPYELISVIHTLVSKKR